MIHVPVRLPTLISTFLILTAPACVSQQSQTPQLPAEAARSDSPIERHGALSVSGTKIVDRQGRPVSLAGPSFFWSTTGWGMERFYNADAVQFFAEDWNAGIVRAAMAAEREGSYLTHSEENAARARTIVDAAIENEIYVVVDWHSHRAEENQEEAIEFFKDLATRYGHTPNLIYEIYNEPLNTTDWETVIKPYSEAVISEIRKIDPDNLIVVGSQSWDQDVDKSADSPILGYENIVYSVHFYAASHKQAERAKAQYAIDKGLPLMATEWGSVSYDGDGDVDYGSSLEWMEFLKKNAISHMIWAVSDADEGAAMFVAGAPANGGWTDEHLTPSGKFARDLIRNWNSTATEE
ncbi:MAG: glycoside hydrolase family 5 protein [Henriciella sp.]